MKPLTTIRSASTKPTALLLACVFSLAVTHAPTQAPQSTNPAGPVQIRIDAAAPRTPVSPELYGIFFEEINHAGDGGLYAEMVQNRDFEANTVDPGWRVEGDSIFNPGGWRTRKWFTNDVPAWSFVAEGGAEGDMQQDAATPLNERNPHSLRLTVTQLGQRCGVANSGYWGMNIEAGEWYEVTFSARTADNRRIGLVYSLESTNGERVCARATIPEVGGPWRRYTLSLQAQASDSAGRLVITPIEPCTLWLDVVSVFPRKTFKDRPNGMRPDLGQMLADLKPGFLRFPGGCVVEGVTLHSRIRWKDSIGDIAQRQGGFDLWGYYNTCGLGFHEYLQLAEDLGAQGMYVINSGQSCQARQPVEYATNLDFYVQDSLDALDYALGSTNSTWGAQRAANGHPAPFPLKYVEIGNENGGRNYQETYRDHYRVFYDAIKARYPQIITIADNRITNAPLEFVDDHFYVSPDRFFRMANQYDNADRSGPKIYVGEYAVNRGVGTGNLLGALSEAVFMLNMERNSDIVRLCSYAPLFENVNKRDWAVNLIRYDSARSVGRTSYQVQTVFAANRPDVILQTQVEAPQVTVAEIQAAAARGRGRGPGAGQSTNQPPGAVSQLYALAGLDQNRRELVIKVVNPTPGSVNAGISLQGLSGLGRQAKVITLSHAEATAENTLENPRLIVPVESALTVPGTEFSAVFTPNSLTVLRVPVQTR